MKELFRSFNKLNNEELATLWQKATFVFDTNTLLSIYRYKSSTSEEVLQLMQQLQDRIWIPYHVALEFHRNRLSVIGDQHKKFDDTRTAINSAIATLKKELTTLQLSQRHRHIDPSPLLEGIEAQAEQYLASLADQEKDSIQVTSEDSLLNRLDTILKGRIGEKPDDQQIQKIMAEGEKRYESKIPPGYKDIKKADDSDNCFKYDGVSYKRQYGDLIVWKQILQNTKTQSIKHLIFVTEDNKEDWWQITKGKTTGFRIELLDEIYQETDLNSFKAYSLGGFLQDAKSYLKDQTLSEDAIDEVSFSVDIPDDFWANVIETEDGLETLPTNNTESMRDKQLQALLHQINDLSSNSLEMVKDALSLPPWADLDDIETTLSNLLSLPPWARPDHLQDLINSLLSEELDVNRDFQTHSSSPKNVKDFREIHNSDGSIIRPPPQHKHMNNEQRRRALDENSNEAIKWVHSHDSHHLDHIRAARASEENTDFLASERDRITRHRRERHYRSENSTQPDLWSSRVRPKHKKWEDD